jgi:hypothetical protein
MQIFVFPLTRNYEKLSLLVENLSSAYMMYLIVCSVINLIVQINF